MKREGKRALRVAADMRRVTWLGTAGTGRPSLRAFEEGCGRLSHARTILASRPGGYGPSAALGFYTRFGVEFGLNDALEIAAAWTVINRGSAEDVALSSSRG